MVAIGIVGYGRFGHALADIFADRGYAVHAYDTSTTVEEMRRSSSLNDLCRASDVLFVAVPVTAMRRVFQTVRSSISADQIVADVGSVKLEPFREMAQAFGEEVPWVASHPLFGPVSLARAEPDLRAVVCPNNHLSAMSTVANLYRSIGCNVLMLDPEEHDRIMAQTHALAFFLAKGMVDADVPSESPAAPPSFQAMARTIESVRADAGHLLTTLHRENPFAAEYRRRLLTVLTELDRRLNEPAGEDSTSGEAALSLDASKQMPELKETRQRIDEVDEEIFSLLLRRGELARRAKHAKQSAGQGIVDSSREAQLLRAREEWARKSHLEPHTVRGVYEAIIRMSSEIQLRAD